MVGKSKTQTIKEAKRVAAHHQLIPKLIAMAEKGEPGERDVAKEKLKQLLKKYSLSENDLQKSKSKERVFKVNDWDDHMNLLLHCILDTKPEASMNGDKKARKICVLLTDLEYLEVAEKFNFYWSEYIKLKHSVFAAFILKNEIGIVEGVAEENSNDFHIEKITELIKNIEAKPFTNLKRKKLFEKS